MALKPPQQARSRRTLDRIERAAIGLISEGGLDAAGVQRIAKRAKSSVGAFYSRFDGKEALILHLHHRLWADVSLRWTEGMGHDAGGAATADATPDEDGADPASTGRGGAVGDAGSDTASPALADTLETIARALFHAFESDARARRLIGATLESGEKGPPPGPNPDPTAGTDTEHPALTALEAIRTEASAALLSHRPDLTHPDPTTAVDVLVRSWIASVASFAEAGTGSAGNPLRDTVAPELVRMGRAYLTGEGSGAGAATDGPTQMEFFEVWG